MIDYTVNPEIEEFLEKKIKDSIRQAVSIIQSGGRCPEVKCSQCMSYSICADQHDINKYGRDINSIDAIHKMKDARVDGAKEYISRFEEEELLIELI